VTDFVVRLMAFVMAFMTFLYVPSILMASMLVKLMDLTPLINLLMMLLAAQLVRMPVYDDDPAPHTTSQWAS